MTPTAAPLPATTKNTLVGLKDGDSAVITSIEGSTADLRRRLYSLGLVPGALVERLRQAPLGDPIQLRVGGSTISIRAREASAVNLIID